MKTEKKLPYNYAIIKDNYPELERESVLLHNNYRKNKKYALICKGCHKDGSESIYFIRYSNYLEDLQRHAEMYPSWYNYPLMLRKDIQGNTTKLN